MPNTRAWVGPEPEVSPSCHGRRILCVAVVAEFPATRAHWKGQLIKALKKSHAAAADHYEKAAEHHRTAAEHASEGDQQAAAHHAHIAQGHALHGHEHAASAAKQHVELYAEQGDEGDDK